MWVSKQPPKHPVIHVCTLPPLKLIQGFPLSTDMNNFFPTNIIKIIVCALQFQGSHGAPLKFPRKTWPSQSQPEEVLFTSFQLSGELGWSSACTHYSEHDLLLNNVQHNCSSIPVKLNTLFLVKSLNTVDFQPRRFSFSNTMLILHNTCFQQRRVSWLQHKHAAIYCAGASSGLYTQFVSIIFLPVKDWQHNAWDGNDRQWPTFPLCYQILGE